MSKFGETLIKLTVFAGGATLGAIASYWLDEELMKRAKQRSDRVKNRYAQGLAPLQPPSMRKE